MTTGPIPEARPRRQSAGSLQPVVGVGGVVIRGGRALLIRRGSAPLKGRWSIPGGRLEWGESLTEGVRRELREETGLDVEVHALIEVFERILPRAAARRAHHFVILDYLCSARAGEPCAGSDVTRVAWARERELARFHLTRAATRVLRKSFRMARLGAGRSSTLARRRN